MGAQGARLAAENGGFRPGQWYGYTGSSPPCPLSRAFLARIPEPLRVLYEGRCMPGETWLAEGTRRFRPRLLVAPTGVLEWQLGAADEASSEFAWEPRRSTASRL
jgi:hypothetical protein